MSLSTTSYGTSDADVSAFSTGAAAPVRPLFCGLDKKQTSAEFEHGHGIQPALLCSAQSPATRRRRMDAALLDNN